MLRVHFVFATVTSPLDGSAAQTAAKAPIAARAQAETHGPPDVRLYRPSGVHRRTDAFLRINASINTVRSPDEIQACVFELIFEIISAKRAAILLAGHDQDRFVSATYPPYWFGKRQSISKNVS